jgi:biopolymer transport protein ExbD
LEYRDVVRIMELCRDGGADEIGLITEKKTG